MKTIDAKDVYYRQLNEQIDEAVKTEKNITLNNVFGQRYIGRGLPEGVKIKINGFPGNDMAVYMDGAELEIFGNGQEAVGNTMNGGRVIVHGNVGDTAGYAMRGGEIYVEGNVGYRVGIHMKEYKETKPVIVIGGQAGDFLGEYMAGGAIIMLGAQVQKGQELTGKYCGTGIHGGAIFVNAKQDVYKYAKEASQMPLSESDVALLQKHIEAYGRYFEKDVSAINPEKFYKYAPLSHNPYSKMYSK
jgi:glutamate synthase domain-containing protein 3